MRSRMGQFSRMTLRIEDDRGNAIGLSFALDSAGTGKRLMSSLSIIPNRHSDAVGETYLDFSSRPLNTHESNWLDKTLSMITSSSPDPMYSSDIASTLCSQLTSWMRTARRI